MVNQKGKIISTFAAKSHIMKPIIYILENPGYDINTFMYEAAKQLPEYSFQQSITAEEEVFVTGIVNVKKTLDAAFLGRFTSLKFIAVAFTGYDSVDGAWCRNNNIAVYNVPEYSTHSVAELTIALAISLLRDIPRGNSLIQNGGWALERPGIELHGKTIGIVGTGAIGTTVASLFKAFGCEIIGWSRTHKQEFIDLGGKYSNSLTELFAQSDIITIHTPSNADTFHLISDPEISAMKPTAFIINTARGPIIDSNALVQALQSNKIAGAALDVFDTEPIEKDNQLLTLPNVILTPHIAFKTKEALQRKALITINNIHSFQKGKDQNQVI